MLRIRKHINYFIGKNPNEGSTPSSLPKKSNVIYETEGQKIEGKNPRKGRCHAVLTAWHLSSPKLMAETVGFEPKERHITAQTISNLKNNLLIPLLYPSLPEVLLPELHRSRFPQWLDEVPPLLFHFLPSKVV